MRKEKTLLKPDIVVIGSLNTDIVAQAKRCPRPGETVTGSDFRMVPGGKGANQAVAAARMSGKTAMVGRIGDDIFGQMLLHSLHDAGVGTDYVFKTPGTPTGTALIILDEKAENHIVVVPGANSFCSVEDVTLLEEFIGAAKILMVQLEVPLQTVQCAVRIAREHGVTVMLDPAPAVPLPPDILTNVDIILPNETEASVLTGRQITDLKSAKLAAVDLICRGVKTVIVKLGQRGAVLVQDNFFEYIAGYEVEAVDTTAAGDAFAGGVAVALAEGSDVRSAVQFANAAGALAVMSFGAQTSMPDRQAVEQFRERKEQK